MAINIKKIKSFKAFCGLDMIEMDEFKHCNIIFGNNGCGKTSLTRAFELLILKNKHIRRLGFGRRNERNQSIKRL